MLVLSGDKVEGAHADGTDWTIPSSVSCTQCHNAESGFALGLELAQLNGPLEHGCDVEAADQYGNQMEMLEALGVIEPLDFPTDSMPTMVDPWDEEAPLEDRARAYLHSNCGSCHTAPENVCSGDLRWSADLAQMGVCNVEPKIKLEEWAPGTMLLAPGQPERSAILFHMNAEQETGAMPMPPLGRDHVDRKGTMLIRDWIASLEGCE
ncbi:MAG: hypothetical protein OXT09_29030 [Myxococcales bacterium]|nr:hypothetical protein [Myxococcales bacterium]